MDDLLEILIKGSLIKKTEELIADFRNQDIINKSKEIELKEYDDVFIVSTITDLGRYEHYKIVFEPKSDVDIHFLVDTLNELGYKSFKVEKVKNKMIFNIGL